MKPKPKKEDTRLRRNPDFYQQLLDAYRTHGINHALVSYHSNTSPATARKAFNIGWPEYEWAPPIRIALETEGYSVRAKIAQLDIDAQKALEDPELVLRIREEIRKEAYEAALKDMATYKSGDALEKEKAKLQAYQTRQEEAELGKYLRARSKVLLGAGSTAMGEFVKLGELLRRRIALLNATPDNLLGAIDPREIVSLMSRYADSVLKIGLVIQSAQAIDRKAAGDPDFVMLHKQQDMSYEEALKVIETAAETHEANKPFLADGWKH